MIVVTCKFYEVVSIWHSMASAPVAYVASNKYIIHCLPKDLWNTQ